METGMELWEQVERYWAATFDERQQLLKTGKGENFLVLSEYHCLRQSKGLELVSNLIFYKNTFINILFV